MRCVLADDMDRCKRVDRIANAGEFGQHFSRVLSAQQRARVAATDPFGNPRIGFEGKVVINRKDWGVNWNAPLEAGGVLVSEKVTIEIDISAIKQQALAEA